MRNRHLLRTRFGVAFASLTLFFAGQVQPMARAQASLPLAKGAATPATIPGYDVVSIKPNKSGSGRVDIDIDDSSFTASNVSLRALLADAFGVREGLVSGLSGWADSSRFDLKAKIVDPDPEALRKLPPEQREAMLAAVLKERFHLQAHRETKMLPVFDLILAPGDRSLRRARRRGPWRNQLSRASNRAQAA